MAAGPLDGWLPPHHGRPEGFADDPGAASFDTGRHLVAGHVLHRAGVHDPPRYPHRFKKNIPVTLRRQEVETDCGRLARIIRRDMYAPGTV